MSFTDYEYYRSLTADKFLSKNFLKAKREIKNIKTDKELIEMNLSELNFIRGGEKGENTDPDFYKNLGFKSKKEGQKFRRKFKISLFQRNSKTHPKSYRELEEDLKNAINKDKKEKLEDLTIEIITIKISPTIGLHQIGLFDQNGKILTFYDPGSEGVKEEYLHKIKSIKFNEDTLEYDLIKYVDYLDGYERDYIETEGQDPYELLARFGIKRWASELPVTEDLRQAIEDLNYFETIKIIKEELGVNSRDEFNFSCYTQIKFNKNLNIKKKKEKRKAGTPFNLLDYIVNKISYKIPFINYADNDEGNCIYDWAKKRYSKIKKLDKYLKKEDNSIGDILKFCQSYNIELKIFNLVGFLLIENNGSDKHYPRWVGIISSGHFYPLDAKKSKNLKPKLNKEPLPKGLKNQLKEDQYLFYEKNGIQFYREGRVESISDKLNFKKFNEVFNYKLVDNFSFLQDTNKIKPLKYVSEDYKKIKYEYDMRKSYFNIAFNFMTDDYKCPVFSCLDRWEEHRGEEIEECYYYLISKKALERLLTIGIYDNLADGYSIKLLIENGKLNLSDIEYYKKPSYIREWKTIREILKIMLSDLGEDHLNKFYPFYNGFLGKDLSNFNLKIGYLDQIEQELLGSAFHLVGGQGDRCVFEMRSSSFNHLNSLTIYNSIVSSCNRLILMNVFSSKQPILKISVDAIAYEEEEEIRHRPDLFKVLSIHNCLLRNNQNMPIGYDKWGKAEEPKLYYCRMFSNYHNGEVIKRNVINELEEKCQDNVSFLGEGGSGKSYYIKNNLKFDYSTTITNQCCSNIDQNAITLHKLFGGKDPSKQIKALKRIKNKTIWVDEVSMIGTHFINKFVSMSLSSNTHFIFSGDFEQLPPINERGFGLDPHSKIILGKIEDLTREENHRMDAPLTALSRSIRTEGKNRKETIKNKLSCINKIDEIDDFKNVDLHICYRHTTRRFINYSIMKERNLTFDLKNNKVSDGVILKVIKKCKNQNLKKGELYRVIDNKLHSITKDKIIDLIDLKNFDIGFASTTHSFQGNTIKEPLVIHDLKEMVHIENLLYTAITRSIELKKIYKCSQKGYSGYIYNEIDEKEENDLILI